MFVMEKGFLRGLGKILVASKLRTVADVMARKQHMGGPEAGPTGDLLRFRREYAHGAVVFRFSGEIDLPTVSQLWLNLKAACEDGDDVIVELSGLKYIDSLGFKALRSCHRMFMERGRRLVLADPSSQLLTLLSILRREKAIPIFPSVEAASDSLQSDAKAVQGTGSTSDRFFSATILWGHLHVRGISDSESWNRTRLRYRREDQIDRTFNALIGDRKIRTVEDLEAAIGEPMDVAPTRTIWIHEGLEVEVRRLWERDRPT